MSENGFNIRAAAESDVDAAYDLMASLGYPGLRRDEFAETFAAVLQHQDMVLLVAESSEGKTVGLASLSYRPQLRLAGTLVTIDELVVADEMRGCGLGKLLLDEARQIASKLCARRLELETSRTRESYLRRFYLKNGFSEADSAVMRTEVAQSSVCDRPRSGLPTS